MPPRPDPTAAVAKVDAFRGSEPAPTPSAAKAFDLADAARVAVIGLFVLAIFAVLKTTADLVVPMVSAVIVGSVLARIGEMSSRLGVPPLVSGLGLVALTGVVIFVLVDALVEPFVDLFTRAPEMLERVTTALRPMIAPLTSLKTAISRATEGVAGSMPVVVDQKDAADRLSGFVGGLTPALGELLVFFATLAFFVVGRDALRRGAILLFEGRDTRLAVIRIFNAVETALAHYFGTTAMIYVGVGVTTAAIAWAAGLPTPMLWGAMTFLASFIPYIGAALIALSLAAGGLVTHDATLFALLPAIAFAVVHLVSENLIIPAILGRRFEINPFTVFVAIVFWTWLWGAMGAVLAVPLLLVATTIHDEFGASPPTLPG